jgi:hypothetical protein
MILIYKIIDSSKCNPVNALLIQVPGAPVVASIPGHLSKHLCTGMCLSQNK